MVTRHKKQNLRTLVDLRVKWLNEALGTPVKPFSENLIPNIGSIHVCGGTHGFRLYRVCKEGGSAIVGSGEYFNLSVMVDVLDVAIRIAEIAKGKV